MMAQRYVIAFAIAFLAFFMVLPAAAAEWVVARVTGTVWIAGNGVQPVSLEAGRALAGGGEIRTEPGARAMLVRGEETVLIGPDTTLTLPRGGDGGVTRIFQATGHARYDVEKKNVRHFSVETPFLAAVVKGTAFTVSIDDDSAAVDVERGRVEVSDPKSGQVVMVRQRQRASVSRSGAAGLTLTGSGAAATPAFPAPDRDDPLAAASAGSHSNPPSTDGGGGGEGFFDTTVTTVLHSTGMSARSLSDIRFEDFSEINTESVLILVVIFLVVTHAVGRRVMKAIRRRKPFRAHS